jgi:hypothetical protein
VKSTDAVALIEASYRLDFSTEEWLEQIAATASKVAGTDLGALAYQYDGSSGDWVHAGIPALHGLSPEFARDFFNQPDIPRDAAAGPSEAALGLD